MPGPPGILFLAQKSQNSEMIAKYHFEKWGEVYAPNAAMLRLLLEREGYRVYQWCEQAGAIRGMNKRLEAQSYWVISGVLEISVEASGTFQLEAGDRFFLEGDAYHSARVIGDEPVLYFVGSKLPPKRKRGRPKKVKKAAEDELPPELADMLRMLGE